MDGDRSKLGGLAWPGLLAVIVSLYAYWNSERRLDSARPGALAPPPWEFVTTGELSAVHARLWDDPLQVSCEDWKSRSDRNRDAPADSDDTAIDIVPSSDEQPVNHESGPAVSARGHFRSLVTTYPARTWGRRQTAGEAQSPAAAGPTVVLPVLMRGGSSPEESDWRRRQQYAVLSGLVRCGFKLDFPDRMSYFVIRRFNRYVVARPDLQVQDTRPFDLVVPAKLVTVDESRLQSGADQSAGNTGASEVAAVELGSIRVSDGGATRQRCQVLVLYVNESQLGARPLDALGGILTEMFGEYSETDDVWQRLYVRVLGPTTSDPLAQYFKPPGSRSLFGLMLRANEADRIRVYSAHATVHVDPAVLREGRELECVPLTRVVGDDQQLVEAIHNELHVRHVCPHVRVHASHASENGDDDHEHPAAAAVGSPLGETVRPHIALITEQDSSYGQKIVNLFENTFGRNNVLTCRYLRGIDGRSWRRGDSSPASASPITAPERGRNDPFTALPRNAEWSWRPEGPSQYDYLLRLRQSLQAHDWELRHSEGGVGIRAIGVVATDVYDKLLVLRALRSSFPEAVFFTTDLDANLSHVDEYPSTRNLIVASHFGLQLHASLQQDIPPFRESYQTSSFLATLLALNLPDAESRLNRLDPWRLDDTTSDPVHGMRPVIFEIGCKGPYQLTLGADEFLRYDTDDDAKLSFDEFEVMPIASEAKGGMGAELYPNRKGLLSPQQLMHSQRAAAAVLLNPPGHREQAFPTSEFWWLAAAAGLLMTLVVIASSSRLGSRSGSETRTGAGTNGASGPMPANLSASRNGRGSRHQFWTVLGLAGVGVIVLGTVIRRLLKFTAISPDFEPFDFINGVSAWPMILLNLAAMTYCCRTLYVWKRKECDEHRKYEQTLKVIELDPEAVPDLERPARFWSVARWALAYVFCGMLAVFGVNGWTWIPGYTRGNVAYLETASRFGAQFAAAFLIAAVVIYHENCRRFVSKLWKQFDAQHERLVIAISLVVDRTETAGRRILSVFVMLLLLSLSFHPCLDFNPVPAGVLIGGGIGFAAILAWSIVVRHQAEKFRRKAVQSLKTHVLRLQEIAAVRTSHWSRHDASTDLLTTDAWDAGWESPEFAGQVKASTASPAATLTKSAVDADADVKRIQAEIAYVEAVDRGAYRPWLSSPATAWLTGSAGAWLGFDWICNWLQTGM